MFKQKWDFKSDFNSCDFFIMFQLDEFEKLDYTSQLTDLKNQVQLKEQQLGKTFFLLEQFDEKRKVLNSFFFQNN